MVIAIVGGTGALGTGLARRWAKAGHEIVIGSRSADKAIKCAASLLAEVGEATITGADNETAAQLGEIVVLTVPYAHHSQTLNSIGPELKGKILVDVTVPLVPPKVARVQLPPGCSAAKSAQEILGDEVRVVSAFQNVAAHHLNSEKDTLCDILVCGNDRAAREEVIKLVEAAGLRGWHAGAIDNSAASEAMTSVLIFINRFYHIDGSGFAIMGEPVKAREG